MGASAGHGSFRHPCFIDFGSRFRLCPFRRSFCLFRFARVRRPSVWIRGVFLQLIVESFLVRAGMCAFRYVRSLRYSIMHDFEGGRGVCSQAA